MANIMGILGGLGQGVSAGVQDLERMEEAKTRKEEAQFRKELQQRERERLAEEKRLGEAVKGIKRSREGFTPEQAAANAQVGYTNLPTRDDEGRLVYGATETAVPRSEAEILKEEAALYSASPDIRNRTLGRQLQGEARVLETQAQIDAERKDYADTLKAINANPDKWYQENLASFNADLTGGPGTRGYKAFPMSTANGTVLNIMDQQGQQIQQIPVTREALARVAKSMHYDKLAGIDKSYAELAMKNEQIGLQRAGLDLRRLEGESEAQYRNRMAGATEARGGLERDRFGLEKDRFTAEKAGGMFSRAPGQFKPLGLGNEGDAIFGVQDGVGKTIPIPKGFSGSFPSLTPKKPRDEVEKAWLDTESALIKNGEKPELIRQQQTAFYARRGVAPPAAEDAMLQGYVLDSKGKQKPLTADDIKEFNRRYPKSAVKPEDLPWYKK